MGVSRSAQFGDRSLFPTLEARAYLNHAAVSPPSSAVRDAVSEVIDAYAMKGVGAVLHFVEERETLRGQLASLVGAEPGEIGFVSNTTHGVAAVALSHPWKTGDTILLFEGEFPTNITPWQRAAERHGLGLKWCPLDPFLRSHEEGMAEFERRLTPEVAMVAVSAVQFQTGLRMPLEAMARLCADRDVALFVDAIQACGSVPINVDWGIDYLSCGGHKWLMGLEGAGFLYVRDKRAQAWDPVFAGWLSHEEPLRFLFEGKGHLRYDRELRRRADVVEAGAQNAVGYAALGASVSLLSSLGVQSIHAHINAYLDRIEPELVHRGFRSMRSAEQSARSGILSLRPPDGVDGGQLVNHLGDEGVAVTFPDGFVRLSPHWPNSLAETGSVLEAFDVSLTRQRSNP